MSMMSIRTVAGSIVLLAAAGAGWGQAAAPAPALAGPPGFASRPVLASPITGVDGRELVLIAVTLEPGASSPPHTHPGDCYGSVVEGTIELRVPGQAPRRFAAGEAYAHLGGLPHQFTNVGTTPVKMINTLVVEKGKPRTVPLTTPIQ